ncbi:MAG: LacI family DNA-binding transcriptional regulator [Thermomicrobiales bacterium]
MRPTSLKDVAARAGVSFQTASKVLNGKGTVSPATRRRILAAADELGYVPNLLARGLLTQSTCTLGVVASDFSTTVLAQTVAGIEREARQRGLAVLIVSTDRTGADIEPCLQTLRERRVDGIITVVPVAEDNPRVGELLRSGVPAVSTHEIAGGGVTTVMADDLATALLPVRHLLSLGHRRIGMITGALERRVTRVRTEGYRQALVEAGLACDPALAVPGDWDIEASYQATNRLLDHAPDLTALSVHTDIMAVGALSALYDRGRRVPDDCAVASCDNLPIAARTIPPLTTVQVPFYEIGANAVRLLLNQLAAGTRAAEQMRLPVNLVYRASTTRPTSPEAEPPSDGPDHEAALAEIGPDQR